MTRSTHTGRPRALADRPLSPRQLELLRWVVRLGAVTDEALALREGSTRTAARSRLSAATRAGLLSRERVLAQGPALYVANSAGIRASQLRGLEPCRVSASGAAHAIACALTAAALEHAYPDHEVMGERELRLAEREARRPLASAVLGERREGGALLHRPDLVLWPREDPGGAPVAVEVELTVKAPRRLQEICRGWGRSRCVAGTVYLASAEAIRPLARAIERAGAGERVALVPIASLPTTTGRLDASARTVPSGA